jgi:hypothetical protein
MGDFGHWLAPRRVDDFHEIEIVRQVGARDFKDLGALSLSI